MNSSKHKRSRKKNRTQTVGHRGNKRRNRKDQNKNSNTTREKISLRNVEKTASLSNETKPSDTKSGISNEGKRIIGKTRRDSKRNSQASRKKSINRKKLSNETSSSNIGEPPKQKETPRNRAIFLSQLKSQVKVSEPEDAKKRDILAEKFSEEYIKNEVLPALDREQVDPIRDAYISVSLSQTSLTDDKEKELVKIIIEGVLAEEKRVKNLLKIDSKFLSNLLINAQENSIPWIEKTEKALSNVELSNIAGTILVIWFQKGQKEEILDRWQKNDNDGGWNLREKEFYNQMVAKISSEDWKDETKGFSARIYNGLWNAAKYDQIVALIKANGADTGQAFSEGRDTGRSKRIEGIWSGWIQPLEHLLQNYIKRVSQLKDNETKDNKTLEKEKIHGAKKILDVMGESKEISILTNYKAIKGSEVMGAFKEKPGTFWGFEDIRLPYIQAARETEFKNNPLRMLEIWNAVENALSEDGYAGLLRNPSEAIEEYIAIGIQKLDKRIEERPIEFENLEKVDFEKKFKQVARSYLNFLSQNSLKKRKFTKVKFSTAELTGIDIGKSMGALACKAGLWWAKEHGQPVYYILDGLKIESVLSYKKYRYERMNAAINSDGSAFEEVITLAEVREILKNWDDLKDVVKLVKKGRIIESNDKMITSWIKHMKDADQNVGERPLDYQRLERRLRAIDAQLGRGNVDAEEGYKLVLEYDQMRLIAKANQEMLIHFLALGGEKLRQWGIISESTQYLANRIINLPVKKDKQRHLDSLRNEIEEKVSDQELKLLLQTGLKENFVNQK